MKSPVILANGYHHEHVPDILGLGVAIGIGIGAALGVALNNIALARLYPFDGQKRKGRLS